MLVWLEGERLVRSVHGVGTIVTDVMIEELRQVYALRMELTCFLARLSPRTPDAETLDLFRDLHRRSLELCLAPDARRFAVLNMDVSHALMTLTENEALRETSEQLCYQTVRIWLKSIPFMDLPEEMRAFERASAECLSALESGHVAAACGIHRAHVSMSFARLRRQGSL